MLNIEVKVFSELYVIVYLVGLYSDRLAFTLILMNLACPPITDSVASVARRLIGEFSFQKLLSLVRPLVGSTIVKSPKRKIGNQVFGLAL